MGEFIGIKWNTDGKEDRMNRYRNIISPIPWKQQQQQYQKEYTHQKTSTTKKKTDMMSRWKERKT